MLLFDDVILMGDGPEQSILLAGEYIYDGYIFSPNGAPESGTVLATANWWADYASDPSDFQDGFFAHKVYVRDLSIDCQGDQCVNVGLPSNVLAGVGEPVPNPAIQRDAQVPPQPIGQLGDAALIIHAAQHCGVENVWVYNGNVNGIDIKGTLNKNAFPNGPLPQSFQQAKAGVPTFVPNATPSSTNVPVMNAYVTRCQVDMNYPKWLAGSPLSTGGSNGQLPIRAIGVAAVVLSFNRIGQRNQPSLFPTAPHGYTNPPDVGPNTNDAMDCPGAWHVLILGNLFTNCGDGVGSDGNGDMIVACNVMYNFGSVGVLSLSKSGKATSQTIIFGNTIFLGSDFASPQQGISIQDTIPPPLPQPGYDLTATPGTVVISNNVIYGSAYNVMIDVTVLGAIVTANILDYAGVEPQGQPVVGEGGTTHWPIPNGAGVRIGGNDIIVEANIFRNAAAAGTKNPSAIGIVFPS
ncbi:MAG TPA: hypothetical protein VJP76_07430, partial [Candidatus Tumulicola sp.]|nr:hypothetical protein [Candidatus Tumulicola sp.]